MSINESRRLAQLTASALATVMLVTAAMTQPAHAGGFLGDVFVRPISPKAADELDKAHAKMGRPLDHAANRGAGAAADAVVPGSGAYVTGGLEARDAIRRGGK